VAWGGGADEEIVWGASCVTGAARQCESIVWGTSTGRDNIVWGTACNGADCHDLIWATSGDGDGIVWSTSRDETIVWGASSGVSGDDVVWAKPAAVESTLRWRARAVHRGHFH
jgi:hypothetical protein